jgi:hypothetical protein
MGEAPAPSVTYCWRGREGGGHVRSKGDPSFDRARRAPSRSDADRGLWVERGWFGSWAGVAMLSMDSAGGELPARTSLGRRRHTGGRCQHGRVERQRAGRARGERNRFVSRVRELRLAANRSGPGDPAAGSGAGQDAAGATVGRAHRRGWRCRCATGGGREARTSPEGGSPTRTVAVQRAGPGKYLGDCPARHAGPPRQPRQRSPADRQPITGRRGIALATNIVTFGLVYWQVDGGGPGGRPVHAAPYPDFQFPQTATEGQSPPDWQPRCPDHLYLSFTNVVAFSPTDTLPLTIRVKGLMPVDNLPCGARSGSVPSHQHPAVMTAPPCSALPLTRRPALGT